MKKARFSIAIVLVFFALPALIAPSLAHEGREVGSYLIEFGWRTEPAYAGVFNGPELTIHTHDTQEPVEGAEDTLQLEVRLGPASMALPLRAVAGEPGHYTADLIPTLPGDYSFRLTGRLGDADIDETFSSADGEFSSVEPGEDILFPAPQSISDLEARIDELQRQIDELRAILEALKSG